MPLVHNNTGPSQNSNTNTFQSSFASTVGAVRTVREVDAQVKSEALAEAKKVVTEDIKSKLAGIAGEIKAETRSATGTAGLDNVGFGKSTIPQNTSLKHEQFNKRRAQNLAELRKAYGASELDNAVVKPIVQELEAAGFTDVKFMWETKYINGSNVETLKIVLRLPSA